MNHHSGIIFQKTKKKRKEITGVNLSLYGNLSEEILNVLIGCIND